MESIAIISLTSSPCLLAVSDFAGQLLNTLACVCCICYTSGSLAGHTQPLSKVLQWLSVHDLTLLKTSQYGYSSLVMNCCS